MIRFGKIGTIILVSLAMILSGCGSSSYTARKVDFSLPQNGFVKVMTFNIRTKTVIDGPNHWNRRKQMVIDTMADNAADVIGLQEAKNSQLEQIRQGLPSYGVYAAGRNDGLSGGESCPILYRKSRFTLNDSGTFWFSNTPSVPGSKDWGNIPPRICSWAYLVEKNSGQGFYVYNVHLDNLSQQSRKKSTHLLTKMIAARKTADPYLVMGDFNMERSNPAMDALQTVYNGAVNTITRDVWQLIHPGKSVGTRHGFHGSFSGPHIDHILICDDMRALDARIDDHNVNGRYPSDHFPVIAKLYISRAPAAPPATLTLQDAEADHGKKRLDGV